MKNTWRQNIGLQAYYLNVYAVIHSITIKIYKEQKFVLYKCKLPYRLMLKYALLICNIRKNKNYHAKRTVRWYLVIYVQNSSWSIPLKCSNNFGSVFANSLDQIPDKCQLSCFPFSNSHINYNFLQCSKHSFCSSL
jgi:hypothetical protein